jgi:hypothetical protein
MSVGRLSSKLPFCSRPEHLGNRCDHNGPQLAYVISDRVFQFRHNGVQFALTLAAAMLSPAYGCPIYEMASEPFYDPGQTVT